MPTDTAAGLHPTPTDSQYVRIDPYSDECSYVINRTRLYRDQRDFTIQPGGSGKPEAYPVNPTRQT